MQGLADGYFVLPYTIGHSLSEDIRTGAIPIDTAEFEAAENEVRAQLEKLVNTNGTKSVDHFHKILGKIMWNKVGMARNATGLKEAISEIQALREEFWEDVRVPGTANEMNAELEKAGRVADFLELGELFAKDALHREESCGGHFREELYVENPGSKMFLRYIQVLRALLLRFLRLNLYLLRSRLYYVCSQGLQD